MTDMKRIREAFSLLMSAKGDIRDDNYRFYSLINYIDLVGFIGHFAFIFLFYIVNVPFMIYANIASTLIYLVCFLCNRKGRHTLAFLLGAFEVCAHLVLASVIIGWASGFHYYLLCLIPFTFMSNTYTNKIKISLTVLPCGIYAAAYAYTTFYAPLVALPSSTSVALNLFNIFWSIAVMGVTSYYYGLIVHRTELSLKKANKELEQLASTDTLTGLYNRRKMQTLMHMQHKMADSTNSPLALIICDIDDFKGFNDQYGHEAGDKILQSVSDILKSSLREYDFISRWGGEEFLIMVAGMDNNRVLAMTERLRENVMNRNLRINDNFPPLSVTMTFGIGIYNGEHDLNALIRKADHALYDGKRQGKNRCIMAK